MGQGSLSVSKESERGFQTCGTAADARMLGQEESIVVVQGGREAEMDDVRFGNVSFNSQMQSPLHRPFSSLLFLSLSYPVHNWPDCPARLTDHPGLLISGGQERCGGRGPGQAGRQDTHSYLLYNVTAKSDLTQVDRQRESRSAP